MLKPALRHLLLLAGESYNITNFESRFENLYTAVMMCLEYNNIVKSGASIVESLYGLQRVTVSTQSESIGNGWVELSRKQRALSVMLSILLPRIMAVLRSRATEINQRRSRADEEATITSAGVRTDSTVPAQLTWRVSLQEMARWAEWGFAKAFPYIELSYDLSIIAYQLMYMTGRSVHHHPVFALLDMSLVRRRHLLQDSQRNGLAEGAQAASVVNSSSGAAASWPVALVLALILAARTAEYLHRNSGELAGEHLSGRLAGEAPLPPPPAPAGVGRGCVVPPLDASLCALCNRKRTNSCASTGGYVLCYLCLLPYVREHRRCPVSGLPCGELDIIRLYEETDVS